VFIIGMMDAVIIIILTSELMVFLWVVVSDFGVRDGD